MRIGLIALLVVAIFSGGIFWYGQINIVCDTPIRYRIGAVDSRFNLDVPEIERIMESAEKVWEQSLGADLFILDEKGPLVINFIYDERQQLSNSESELKEDLAAKEGMSETVAQQYEILITEFRSLKSRYEAQVVTYESRLTAYNREVSEWNDRGGAPEEMRREFESRADALNDEQEELQAFAKRLNAIIDELNRIGARGNSLIADYNTIVEEYNNQFAQAREFAQGDYTGSAINIYEFNTEEELTLVLAHEFGHALSLEHVESERSIMFHLMAEQELSSGITTEDREEYNRVCTDRPVLLTALRSIRTLFW